MESLKETEPQTFDFFELTPDLVCIAGKDGYFRKVNPAVMEKLGYTEEELFERPIASFIHPDDKELTRGERAKLLGGQPLLNFQNRYLTKTGKTIWFEWTSIYIPDREIVFAIAKDITKRKQTEKEIEEKYIKFKSLATHFKSSLEESRKYLAVELHEELAQLASVVKMDIDWVCSNEPGLSASSQSRIGHAMAVVELLISAIRRISFSISPHMLDDLGLYAALEWQCKEFSVLKGIPCIFEGVYDESHLTKEIQLDFFRICQEFLNHIMYQSQASKVRVSIEDIDDGIVLTITNDGIGPTSLDPLHTPGLINIRERVALINGHLNIQSEPGRGTKVEVRIARL